MPHALAPAVLAALLLAAVPASAGEAGKPDLRGRSRGWTPVHAQLAALASCTAITVAVVARDQGFA